MACRYQSPEGICRHSMSKCHLKPCRESCSLPGTEASLEALRLEDASKQERHLARKTETKKRRLEKMAQTREAIKVGALRKIPYATDIVGSRQTRAIVGIIRELGGQIRSGTYTCHIGYSRMPRRKCALWAHQRWVMSTDLPM